MGTRSNHLQGYQLLHDQELLTPEKRREGVLEGKPLAGGWSVERLAGKKHGGRASREQRERAENEAKENGVSALPEPPPGRCREQLATFLKRFFEIQG